MSVFGGVGLTAPTTVRLSLPPDTDLKFTRVHWKNESLKTPPYYGVRATRWFSSWGLGLEFIHAKIIAQLGKTIHVEGKRSGIPISIDEPLGKTFQDLSFTHGYNMLFLNVTKRWMPHEFGAYQGARKTYPYVGCGLGVTIPHSEIKTEGNSVYEYQTAGYALQLFVGLTFTLSDKLSLFPEYKISTSTINSKLNGGGEVRLTPVTHHLIIGVSFDF